MTTPRTVVITDCDHDSIALEQSVADSRDATLRRAQAVTEDDVVAAAIDADAIIVQYAPITAAVLDRLPRLRAISRYGVGVDTIDLDAASARSIAVCNVPDYGTEDVSDHAIALILDVARGVSRLDRSIRAGTYDVGVVRPLHRTRERTVGIIGFGLIGAATARKARGIGFHVVAFDVAREPGSSDDGVQFVGFDELLSVADIVSLHVPLIPDTHHLINERSLALFRPGAALVNTCRGGVVDTVALVKALDSGAIGAAALDVFEDEPLTPDHPLVRSDRTTLTPHAAWYSEESYVELKTRAAQLVLDVLDGERPREIVNAASLNQTTEQR